MAPPRRRRRDVEDADNTWNAQLMAAVLRSDHVEAAALLERGASAADARELTPFSTGCCSHMRFSPLAALLLHGGVYTSDVLATAQLLLQHGADLNERMPLPTMTTTTTTTIERSNTTATATAAAVVDADGSATLRMVSAADSKSTSSTTTSATDSLQQQQQQQQQHTADATAEVVDCGTMLHLAVALGDHAHLLQLLLLAGKRRGEALPQSLLHVIEADMAAAAAAATAAAATASSSEAAATTANAQATATSNSNSNAAAAMQRRGSTSSTSPSSASRAVRTSRGGGGGGGGGGGSSGRSHTSAERAPRGDGDARTLRSPLPPFASLQSLLSTRHARLRMPGTSHTRHSDSDNDNDDGHDDVLFDLDARTTRSGVTAADMALQCHDAVAVRLLCYFGADAHFDQLVNGTQTALARACARGDCAAVEALLDAGDSVAQLSRDGRYTLVHYAAAHPHVLACLARRGLSLDAANARGESALVSLISHGTGRNAAHALKETPRLGDAARLAALPAAAQRNYILTPLPPPLAVAAGGGGGGGKSKSGGGGLASTRSGGGNASAARPQPQQTTTTAAADDALSRTQGGTVVAAAADAHSGSDTWWHFASLPTADMLHNLLECGANVNGHVPDDELHLRYVHYAEELEVLCGGGGGGGNAVRASVASVASGDSDDDDAQTSALPPVIARACAVDDDTLSQLRLLQQSTSTKASTDDDDDNNNAVATSAYRVAVTAALQPRACPARVSLRMTPLMLAIVHYHPELIRKLVVEYRAHVMQRDSQGACALHYAALCRHRSVMELLLSPGVMSHDGGASAAATAATTGSGGAGAMATLLSASTTTTNTTSGGSANAASAAATSMMPVDVNATDLAGRTPLHYAAAKGNVAVVQLLLGLGVSVQAGRPDAHGATPLHVAVRANHVRVVQLLVRHAQTIATALSGLSLPLGSGGGAGLLSSSSSSTSSSTIGGGGVSSLSAAAAARRARQRSPRAVGGVMTTASSALFSSSSSASAAAAAAAGHSGNSSFANTAATAAVATSSSSSSLLLSTTAAAATTRLGSVAGEYVVVDVEAEDGDAHATALELAVTRRSSTAIVRTLLAEAHASHARPSGLHSGGTLLHRAVVDGALATVQMLLVDYFADANEPDYHDETPLFAAVKLAATAAAAAAAEDGNTSSNATDDALVSYATRVDVVVALLRNGALPHAQSAVTLDTPLHIAARHGDARVLSLLTHQLQSSSAGAAAAGATLSSSLHTQHAATSSSSSSGGVWARQLTGASLHDSSDAASSLSSLAQRVRERREARRRDNDNNSNSSNNVAYIDDVDDDEGDDDAAAVRADTQLLQAHSQQPPLDDGDGGTRVRVAHTTRSRHTHGATAAAAAAPLPPLLLPHAQLHTRDADGRSLLHVLCMHTHAHTQAAVLPLLRELVAQSPSSASSHTSQRQQQQHESSQPSPTTRQHHERTVAPLRDRKTNAAGDDDDNDDDAEASSWLCRCIDLRGRTALHEACRARFTDAVAVLLQHCPRLALCVDARGYTPLHDCVSGARVVRDVENSSNDDSNSSNAAVVTAAESGGVDDSAAAVHAMVRCLQLAVQQLSPCTLRGFALSHTTAAAAAAADAASLSSSSPPALSSLRILTQLRHVQQQQRHHRYRLDEAACAAAAGAVAAHGKRHNTRAVSTTTLSSSSSPCAGDDGDRVVDWSSYAHLTDMYGRTPLLLAGEVGDVAAARALLRLTRATACV